ncbi:MAG: 4Fe-4S binding protein, partial [Planctomycetes bacterium]|nr:4Fe-4S binding protein [Planctomycetota bacterium]
LVAAAFVIPLATRRQLYCHHVCPHGAAQQLLKNLIPYHIKLPGWAARTLSAVPWLLLLAVLLVAMWHCPFSLASLEPFDAYLFRVAGWASIMIAVVGLAASLIVPMAYCRFGCPTGAVLNFLRLQGRGDRFRFRDVAALGLVVVAGLLYVFR